MLVDFDGRSWGASSSEDELMVSGISGLEGEALWYPSSCTSSCEQAVEIRISIHGLAVDFRDDDVLPLFSLVFEFCLEFVSLELGSLEFVSVELDSLEEFFTEDGGGTTVNRSKTRLRFSDLYQGGGR